MSADTAGSSPGWIGRNWTSGGVAAGWTKRRGSSVGVRGMVVDSLDFYITIS
jgi:hypothetical protein